MEKEEFIEYIEKDIDFLNEKNEEIKSELLNVAIFYLRCFLNENR